MVSKLGFVFPIRATFTSETAVSIQTQRRQGGIRTGFTLDCGTITASVRSESSTSRAVAVMGKPIIGPSSSAGIISTLTSRNALWTPKPRCLGASITVISDFLGWWSHSKLHCPNLEYNGWTCVRAIGVIGTPLTFYLSFRQVHPMIKKK